MTRLLTSTASLILTALITHGQTKQTNAWSAMNLKGNIKTMKVSEYRVHEEMLRTFGEIKPSTIIMSETYIFNAIGNNIEYNRYYANGRLICKYICTYDSIGRAIEGNSFNKKKKLISKTTFKYDNSGYVAEENNYKRNEKWIHKYDENGNSIEENRIDSDGKLIFKFTLKYDGNENAIEGNSYSKRGEILYKYSYKYNQNKNLIEQNILEPNGAVVNRIVYTYVFDNKGNWIKRITYRMDLTSAVHKNDVPVNITEREIEYF